MKRITKILMVLLVVVSLCACSKGGSTPAENPEGVPEIEPIDTPDHTEEEFFLCTVYPDYEKYAPYLEKVDSSKAELGYTFYLDPDTGLYKLWLDNNGSRYFARAYIDVFDGEYAEEPVYSSEYNYLIRPNDFYRFGEESFEAEPAYYELYEVEAFDFTYEKGLDYEIYYDSNEIDGYVIDVFYEGSLDDDTALRIAKKEYVIGVITSLLEDGLYIFEDDGSFDGQTAPDLSKAVYKATFDFESKNVTLYKDGEQVSSVTMD